MHIYTHIIHVPFIIIFTIIYQPYICTTLCTRQCFQEMIFTATSWGQSGDLKPINTGVTLQVIPRALTELFRNDFLTSHSHYFVLGIFLQVMKIYTVTSSNHYTYLCHS